MKSASSILAILIVASIALSADDPFSGKWKGEISAGPCAGFGAPGGGFPGGGGGGGFPGGGGRGAPGLNFVEAGQRGGGGFPGGRGGGGFPGGPDGGGFPGGGRGGVAQKVTLNIKAKEDKKKSEIKLTGNLTIGETTEDVRDGKVDSTISFTTGKPPSSCQYTGEIDVETKELRLTRTIVGSAAQGIQFRLKR